MSDQTPSDPIYNVLFLCTANMLEPIHPAFRDRLEILRLSGYTEEEKVAIVKKHLLPRQLEDNGIDDRPPTISENAVRKIIGCYTHESGLRSLERQIAKICRKVARRRAEGDERQVRVTAANVPSWLGTPPTLPESALDAL